MAFDLSRTSFDGIEGLSADEANNSREPDEAENIRSVSCFKTMTTARKLKLLSEAALDEALPWHLDNGTSYHCISCGDVDSLTYMRHVVRQQPIKLAILSTWCMALEDAREIDDWVNKGMVGRVEFYVGEIFKNGYRGVLDELCAIATKTGGRVARFRNHSKVMVLLGERFDCVIESSANINTNPRCEQTVVTVDSGLARFYKDYYDGINDFDGRFKNWEPYDC